MSFLSFNYLLFFPITLLIYFSLPYKRRHVWLLMASVFFYCCAGTKYIPFLLVTGVITYIAAIFIEKFPNKKILSVFLVIYIGTLFIFKYLDFGASLLHEILLSLGFDWTPVIPKLLLPVGISFYTFSAMGYIIDVYRGKIKAERNFIYSSLFLFYFPALISGPIGRADLLIPQFKTEHKFNYIKFKEGILLFLWGALKKMLLADRLAVMVNNVFLAPSNYGSIQVIAAACAFSVQIYCDFSAYSDMALGSSRAMGIELINNFKTPYFSTSIADFWRKWHISLTSWFRDYLYFPLGGSRKGNRRTYLNILIVFAVSGLWHGAAITFLIWGLINGIYQVIGRASEDKRSMIREKIGLKKGLLVTKIWQMLCVFVLSTIAWVFFKSNSLASALDVFKGMLSPILLVHPISAMGLDKLDIIISMISFLLIFIVEYKSQSKNLVDEILGSSRFVRWTVYMGLIIIIAVFGCYGTGYNPQDFIYGQF